ncbi:NAD(P)H-dependent oxidoreductase [Macrococcoides canis]|uniref:NAD(P)H-dependent oxidoreductase n=1 Tax=Macrococcoides canis TaxID=1855823 RepID=UPI0010617131|nr:NAD(P)H-dependent oxidoreductase [Macrococcus canis]MEE1106957.1 NAD(P)H-dependent oxidoreductase [Macrococcus canis]TDM21317.1 NAD(P)H-dependent oxidoreductase [Macrococcus canis]TDM38584.1 NAD(P)H-dependent oxidoreductase [Macrococcus canis]TDM42935.1 NAD(P)H-dependent oxidoreductase [Macrococcus canis]
MDKEQLKAQILEAHNFRFATKVFDKDKKIDESDMKFILEVGRLSPSSINLEPWRFVILDNQQVKDEIKQVGWGAAKGQLDTASHFVLILAKRNARYDSQLFKDHFGPRVNNDEILQKMISIYEGFQTNDIEVADNERALFDWASKQTYIALGNMMTAAAEIGIDSCPIEGFNYKAVNEILTKHDVINPEEEGISVMVAFGYRAQGPKRPKARRSYDDVVSRF